MLSPYPQATEPYASSSECKSNFLYAGTTISWINWKPMAHDLQGLITGSKKADIDFSQNKLKTVKIVCPFCGLEFGRCGIFGGNWEGDILFKYLYRRSQNGWNVARAKNDRLSTEHHRISFKQRILEPFSSNTSTDWIFCFCFVFVVFVFLYRGVRYLYRVVQRRVWAAMHPPTHDIIFCFQVYL